MTRVTAARQFITVLSGSTLGSGTGIVVPKQSTVQSLPAAHVTPHVAVVKVDGRGNAAITGLEPAKPE